MQVERLSVTVVLAVKNEQANLSKCLRALGPAQRVVVLDSGSTDATTEIAREAGAEVIQFSYVGGYPKKRQWALEQVPIDTKWTMLLDADEVVPDALWKEIASAIGANSPPAAFLVMKGFHFLGRPMRFGGFSHSAVVLFRTGTARFERLVEDTAEGLDMEVHERLLVEGAIARLSTPLVHEDFKGLEAYIARHNKYSTWEARVRHAFLTAGSYGEDPVRPRAFGNVQERRRFLKGWLMRMPGEQFLWFCYHFLFRLGFLEGRRGLIAAQIRKSYIEPVRAKVFELGLRAAHSRPK
jgi:glycosyltransferase involved in cell wall biosynthesis